MSYKSFLLLFLLKSLRSHFTPLYVVQLYQKESKIIENSSIMRGGIVASRLNRSLRGTGIGISSFKYQREIGKKVKK